MSSRRKTTSLTRAGGCGLLLSALIVAITPGARSAASDPFPEASPASRGDALVLLAERTGHPDRCGTPAIRLAAGDPALRRMPGVSRALDQVGLPAELTGSRIAHGPRGLRVEYTVQPGAEGRVDPTDADRNGRPDVVDAVLDGLSTGHRLFVEQLGLAAPRLSRVVLADLGPAGRGYLGGARTAEQPAWIVLHSSPPEGAEAIRQAALHQYAHAVVIGRAAGISPGWDEAIATWAELAQGETAQPELARILSERMTRLDRGLAATDPGLAAGNALWLAFVEQRYGIAAVRGTIDELGRGDAAEAALERGLRKLSSDDLAAAFREFHLWSILVGSRSDGLHFSFAENLDAPVFASTVDGLPALSVHADPALASFGAAQLRLLPRSGPGGMRIRFEGDFAARWSVDLLLAGATGALRRVPLTLSVDGGGSCTVPLDDLGEAILLVRNLGSEDGESHRFTLAAHRERQFPFVLDALEAVGLTPPEAGVLVSWDTHVEQELVGFNVLRQRVDGGPSIAVNPVWVPAMGDESHPSSYHYLDRSAEQGVAYRYRIEGVIANGLTSRSKQTAVHRPTDR